MPGANTSYLNIFKSTFLFGFVQVFNILAKVVLNKCAAVFLGAEGVGLIGIYQSLVDMFKIFFGLGINQSAVRDVSKANADSEDIKLQIIIGVVRKLVLIASFVGVIVSFFLFPVLLPEGYGIEGEYWVIAAIGIVVGLSILSEGQLALLKGLRRQRSLAKASVFGSCAGLISGIPLYFYFGTDGIVPVLFSVAFAVFFYSWLYTKNIKHSEQSLNSETILVEGVGILKMGIALMFVGFVGLLYIYLVKMFIEYQSGIEYVGYYQAGVTIVTGYFGIVITAMATDYYPRISSVHQDNKKISDELNKQVKVGVVLLLPIVVVFIMVVPFLLPLLYSQEFLPSLDFINVAIFSAIIIVYSNAIGMILLAKQSVKLFLIFVLVTRTIGILVSVLSYNFFGLIGLGVAELIMAVIYLLYLTVLMKKKYGISFEADALLMLLTALAFFLVALLVTVITVTNIYLQILFSALVLLLSVYYSVLKLKSVMGIDMFAYFRIRG